MNTSRFCSLLMAVGLALACSLTSANAAVLYDSRSMAIDGSWDRVKSSIIGGFGRFGQMLDHQVADDFTVTSPVELTRVTADFWSTANFAVPADGWLVEVFPDVGGKPSEVPAHAVSVASATVLGTFPWTGGGGFLPSANIPERRSTFEIDLTGQGVALGVGTWWISVVAVDETPFGVDYRWVGTGTPLSGAGHTVHARDGGIAHGNGYPGPDGIPFAWTSLESATPSNSRPYQLSMRIEGNIIPAPAATALLTLCGLTTALNRRRRD